MGDLVVARKGRVHGRAPPHHVGEDAEHDEVADDHAHCGSHQRIDAAAMPTRPHVAPPLAHRRDALEDDFPDELHERAVDVESVREEGAVARVRLLLGLDAAHGEDRLFGLAGEQVAAAAATVGQQPASVCQPTLDFGAVLGRRADLQGRAVLLDPAKRGNLPRWTRAGSRPGWRRSGKRGRSPTRSAGIRHRRASEPCSARCRWPWHAAGPVAPVRRSRGTGFRGRRSSASRPGAWRRVRSPAACIRRRPRFRALHRSRSRRRRSPARRATHRRNHRPRRSRARCRRRASARRRRERGPQRSR